MIAVLFTNCIKERQKALSSRNRASTFKLGLVATGETIMWRMDTVGRQQVIVWGMVTRSHIGVVVFQCEEPLLKRLELVQDGQPLHLEVGQGIIQRREMTGVFLTRPGAKSSIRRAL